MGRSKRNGAGALRLRTLLALFGAALAAVATSQDFAIFQTEGRPELDVTLGGDRPLRRRFEVIVESPVLERYHPISVSIVRAGRIVRIERVVTPDAPLVPGSKIEVRGSGFGPTTEVWLGDLEVAGARVEGADRLRFSLPLVGAGRIELAVRTGTAADVLEDALEVALIDAPRFVDAPARLTAAHFGADAQLWLAGDVLGGPELDALELRYAVRDAQIRALASGPPLWIATSRGLHLGRRRERARFVTEGDFWAFAPGALPVLAGGRPTLVRAARSEVRSGPFEARALLVDGLRDDHLHALDPTGQLWTSSGGGVTWDEGPVLGATDLELDPRDCRQLFAAAPPRTHRSPDGGRTWRSDGPALERLAVIDGHIFGASSTEVWTRNLGRWRKLADLPAAPLVGLGAARGAVGIFTERAVGRLGAPR